jgi:hypothetical protein
MTGIAPAPTDGMTYVAMSTGEQVSQKLCQSLTAANKASVKLDVVRMDIGNADMFLQIWGGSAADCSSRQLLWVSPALNTMWTTYCVTLAPGEFMDMLTLRADTPVPGLVVSYLAVDNLQPVDACP